MILEKKIFCIIFLVLHFTTLPGHVNQTIAASLYQRQKIQTFRYGYNTSAWQWSKYTVQGFSVGEDSACKYLPKSLMMSHLYKQIASSVTTVARGLQGNLVHKENTLFLLPYCSQILFTKMLETCVLADFAVMALEKSKYFW